jgi:hypothetical protein
MTEQQFQPNNYAAANSAMLEGFAPETAALVQNALDDGEQILWTGKPDTLTVFKQGVLFPTFFAGVWCLFNILAPERMLYAIPALFLGIIAVWFISQLTAQKTIWALTNQRAIKAGNAKPFEKYISSYFYHRHILSSTIGMKQKADRSGSLRFALQFDRQTNKTATIQFENMQNVEQVRQILKEAVARNVNNPLGHLRLSLQDAMTPHFYTNEKVLWTSMPDQYWMGQNLEQKQLVKLILLGGASLAFLIFSGMFASTIIGFFGLTFSLMYVVGALGLFLAAVALFVVFGVEPKKSPNMGNANKIGYLITDRRFIQVDTSGSEPKIEVYNNADIQASKLKCVKHKDGTGDIHLQLRGEYSAKFSFFGVHEPEKVKGIIETVVAEAQSKTA